MRSRRPTALLVGLKGPLADALVGTGSALEAAYASTWRDALERIRALAPAVMLVARSLEREVEGGALAATLQHSPEFRGSVAVVDPDRAADGLVVHEWDPDRQAHASRSCPVSSAPEELEAIAGREVARRSALAAIRRIGFNDTVCLGERTLHVQTEVVGMDGLRMRSMIIERGQVLRTATAPYPEGVLDPVRGAELVHRQHLEMLARARDGQGS